MKKKNIVVLILLLFLIPNTQFGTILNKNIEAKSDQKEKESVPHYFTTSNGKIPTFFDWVENKTFGFKSGVVLQARLLIYDLTPLVNKKVLFYIPPFHFLLFKSLK